MQQHADPRVPRAALYVAAGVVAEARAAEPHRAFELLGALEALPDALDGIADRLCLAVATAAAPKT